MMLGKPIFVPTGRVAKRKQGSTMQAKNSQGAKRIAASAFCESVGLAGDSSFEDVEAAAF